MPETLFSMFEPAIVVVIDVAGNRLRRLAERRFESLCFFRRLDVIESLLPRRGIDFHADWIRISKSGHSDIPLNWTRKCTSSPPDNRQRVTKYHREAIQPEEQRHCSGKHLPRNLDSVGCRERVLDVHSRNT